MLELTESQYAIAADLFTDMQHSLPMIQSIMQHLQPARVFTDDLENPDVALIVFEDFLFIGGKAANRSSIKDLYDLVYDQIYPHQQFAHLEIHTSSTQWCDIITNTFRDKIYETVSRTSFKLNHQKFRKAKDCEKDLPKGYRLIKVENRTCFRVIRNDEIVSECAALFKVNGLAEIDIETNALYRNQGFAFITSIACIEHCLSHDIEPLWSCFDRIKGSSALARKLGYEETHTHQVIVLSR